MKYLVVYSHERGFGNVDCVFKHNPPCVNDIRDAEKEILERFNCKQVLIINWLMISDE